MFSLIFSSNIQSLLIKDAPVYILGLPGSIIIVDICMNLVFSSVVAFTLSVHDNSLCCLYYCKCYLLFSCASYLSQKSKKLVCSYRYESCASLLTCVHKFFIKFPDVSFMLNFQREQFFDIGIHYASLLLLGLFKYCVWTFLTGDCSCTQEAIPVLRIGIL